MINHPEYSYKEKTWTVNSGDEHELVFSKDAPEWLKQWKFHEDCHEGNLLDDNDFNLSEISKSMHSLILPY